jgi:hypothetical protein
MRRSLPRLVLLALLGGLALIEPATAAPDGTVSEIRDDRIMEASGLALSAKHDDLVYTINDRGTHPTVYAIQLSTGKVIGTTDISGLDIEDTESIAVDENGTLWLGDLGDNDHERSDASIISFPEPGPGRQQLESADRYGVQFPAGPVDVEGMMIHPDTGRVFLVSKNRDGLGAIYRLPALTPGDTVIVDELDAEAPRAVTDATFTHTGDWALLRTNHEIWVYNPKTWEPVQRVETPDLDQGESITVERGDRTVLLGSEGKNSPIVRVPLPDPPTESEPVEPIELDGGSGSTGSEFLTGVGLGLVGILVVAVLVLSRKPGRRR